METRNDSASGARTLDKLLYLFRDKTGKTKDSILLEMYRRYTSSKPLIIDDVKLTSFLTVNYLQRRQRQLSAFLNEIEQDELIEEYLSHERKDTLQMKLMHIRDQLVDMDSSLDIKGLVELSDKGSDLYDFLEPTAKATENLERKTKLYTDEYWIKQVKEQIGQYLSSASPDSFSVAVLDLNHFRNYNNLAGHLQGDEVVKQLATILKKTVQGVPGRSSSAGDEFYILKKVTDAEGLKGIFDMQFLKDVDSHLIQNVQDAYAAKEQKKHYSHAYDNIEKFGKKITCSVGISSPNINGKSLLQRAYEKIDDPDEKSKQLQETDGASVNYKHLKEKLAEEIAAGHPDYKIYENLDVQQRELLKEKMAYTLIKEADDAMYAAKKLNKQAYEIGQNISASLIYQPDHSKERELKAAH